MRELAEKSYPWYHREAALTTLQTILNLDIFSQKQFIPTCGPIDISLCIANAVAMLERVGTTC